MLPGFYSRGKYCFEEVIFEEFQDCLFNEWQSLIPK